MKRLAQWVTATSLLAVSVVAFGQASELRKRIQEDLDSWKPEFVSSCGNTDKLTFKFDGKLASEDEIRSVSTLCSAAFEGAVYTCRENEAVKKVIGEVTAISCSKGAGTIGYKLVRGNLTLTVDPTYVKNSPSGQRDDLVAKLRKDLDK